MNRNAERPHALFCAGWWRVDHPVLFDLDGTGGRQIIFVSRARQRKTDWKARSKAKQRQRWHDSAQHGSNL